MRAAENSGVGYATDRTKAAPLAATLETAMTRPFLFNIAYVGIEWCVIAIEREATYPTGRVEIGHRVTFRGAEVAHRAFVCVECLIGATIKRAFRVAQARFSNHSCVTETRFSDHSRCTARTQ